MESSKKTLHYLYAINNQRYFFNTKPILYCSECKRVSKFTVVNNQSSDNQSLDEEPTSSNSTKNSQKPTLTDVSFKL